VTSEAHYEEIISFIDYSIYNFQNQLDQKYMNNDQTENKEKVRIILKYRWLKEFIEWYLKGDFNDKERFYFPLKQ
jgi:predicted nucleotide-binding protein (sugar kinase/HSP70/actin superfamily)